MKIHLSRAACGYELDAQTGPIEANADAVREAVEHLEHSPFSESAQGLLQGAEEVTLERAIYRCRACGAIHPILQARAIWGGVMVCPVYNCESCGKMLGKVKPADLKKLACPRCKGPLTFQKTKEEKQTSMYGLSKREQCQVIYTAQVSKPFSECPVQSEGAKKFYDSLRYQMEKLPGVLFDYPELDDDEERSEAMQAIMFEGMGLK